MTVVSANKSRSVNRLPRSADIETRETGPGETLDRAKSLRRTPQQTGCAYRYDIGRCSSAATIIKCQRCGFPATVRDGTTPCPTPGCPRRSSAPRSDRPKCHGQCDFQATVTAVHTVPDWARIDRSGDRTSRSTIEAGGKPSRGGSCRATGKRIVGLSTVERLSSIRTPACRMVRKWWSPCRLRHPLAGHSRRVRGFVARRADGVTILRVWTSFSIGVVTSGSKAGRRSPLKLLA